MINISDLVVHLPAGSHPVLLLYVGPDQMMPLLSVVGAAVGLLLMWWRRLMVLTRRALKYFNRKPQAAAKHFK